MGNTNNIIHSKQQILYYHIHRKQYQKCNSILDKKPQLLNKPLTKDTKHTLLMRAVFSMCKQSVQYVLNRGPDINYMTPKGQTALSIAIRKNKIQIVQLLINKGAKVDLVNPQGIAPIDLAILQGLLPIARLIYSIQSNNIKQLFQYQDLSKKYHYRYVNFPIFIKLLIGQNQDQTQPQNDFLTKQKKQLFDPVPDPRQNWQQWFKRNLDFKDAPMVQRSQLPQQLQPQNRKLGKLDILINNWIKSDAAKKSTFKPKQGRQVVSQMNNLVQRQKINIQKDYQSAI